MKTVIATAALTFLMIGAAHAQSYHPVSPYTRQDGTYVQPHYRTNPDRNPYNNWTTAPNVNPFTGQHGTRQPSYGGGGYGYGTPRSSNPYGSPRRY